MSALHKHLSGKPQWYKKVASDARLSYRAVGMLTFILAQTEGWDLTVESLARNESADDVKAVCQELVTAGYMTRQERKGKVPITHVADVAFDQWARRTAAKDFVSKPASPKPITHDDRALAAGTAETGSAALELAPPADLAEYRTNKAGGPDAIAKRVLVEWTAAVGRDPARTRLNGERLRKVEARLSEGYTEQDLIEAVRGIGLSSWHMGDNSEGKKWDEMTLALRNGSNVEKFRDLYAEGGGQKMDAVDRAIALMQSGGDL